MSSSPSSFGKRAEVKNPFLDPEQVEIGYWTAPEEYDCNKLARLTVMAEKVGLESVLTSDHLQPWFDTNGHSGFAWSWMAATAAITRNIAFGTGVTAPDRYHPALIAQMFASFDEMFPGRCVLGLGAGEALNSRAIGIEWPSKLERVLRLQEAIEIIRNIWNSGGKRVSYGGQHFRLNRMKLYSLPPTKIPIYVAAAGEMTARIAGKYGDGLVTTGEPLRNQNKEFYNMALEEAKRARGPDAKLGWLVEIRLSYDKDYKKALKHARTWAATAIDNPFEKPWLDPRRYEEEGRVVTDETMAKKYGVTTDIEEFAKTLGALKSFGYTKIQIHSSSPNEEDTLNEISKILPSLRK
jgi:coenzyme F420-dependent glucose-6-phosphate dehydrogenase